MKNRYNYSAFQKKHAFIPYITPILANSVVIIIVIAALLMNTMDMSHRLQENTERYAEDVAAQLASNISARMNMRKTYIRNLADTFSRMPESVLTEELLKRKAEYLEMDEVFLLNADGSSFPADVIGHHPELKEHLKIQPDIHQDAHIFYSEHQEVFFSAPIFRQNGGETRTLVGIRTNEMLQKMLQDVDFKDQGLCCIVDANGTVIVSATDETPFSTLKDILSKGLAGDDEEAIQRQVLDDIAGHVSGVVQLDNVWDESLIFCYDFLEVNDWMLLTLLPANLFSTGTNPHLIRYIVIIGVMALTMLLIFICVVQSYRQSFRAIQTAALSDPLTGGFNRLAFQIDATKEIQKTKRTSAIVHMNIRGFKRLNEKLGSAAGDKILRQIHGALQSCLKEGELLCRTAGDHFYLLLKCADQLSVAHRVEHMFLFIDKQLSAQHLTASSSIAAGAYLITHPENDFTILIDRAKRAGDQAQTGECRFFDAAFEKQMEREHTLEDSFPRALKNHEFQLYIQPKVCPGRKKADGGEVLVRWQHPDFGLVSPGEFIPLFERNGTICELDFYMFEETCKLLKTWLAEGVAVPLSVNLSRAHLISSDLSFLDRFKTIKEKYQIPDGLIDLELTESLMLERSEIHLVTSMINRIRELGFLCSIDDFGFGYSSLTMLKDLNVTTVKLDRQFFLNESKKSWLVVRQLIHLAHDLGISVVAEGIEEREQVEILKDCSCDLIQGYIYAKPMPASDFAHWSDDSPV